MQTLPDISKVTRLEVIDHTGREGYNVGRHYVSWNENTEVSLSFQDGGRTLKIFVDKRQCS